MAVVEDEKGEASYKCKGQLANFLAAAANSAIGFANEQEGEDRKCNKK